MFHFPCLACGLRRVIGQALPLLFLQASWLEGAQDASAAETPLSLLEVLIDPDVFDRNVHFPTKAENGRDEKPEEEKEEEEEIFVPAADFPPSHIKALVRPSAVQGTSTTGEQTTSSNMNEQFSDLQISSPQLVYGKSGVTENVSPQNRPAEVPPGITPSISLTENNLHSSALVPPGITTPISIQENRVSIKMPSFPQQARSVIHGTLGLPISVLNTIADSRKQPVSPMVTTEYSKLLKKVSRPGKNKRYGVGNGVNALPWWVKHEMSRRLSVFLGEKENAEKEAKGKYNREVVRDLTAARFLSASDGERSEYTARGVSAAVELRDSSNLSGMEAVEKDHTQHNVDLGHREETGPQGQHQRHESPSMSDVSTERILSYVPIRAGKRGINVRKHKSSSLHAGARKARRGQEKRDYYDFPQELQRSNRKRGEQARPRGRETEDIIPPGLSVNAQMMKEPFAHAQHPGTSPFASDAWLDDFEEESYDMPQKAKQQQLPRPPPSDHRRIQTNPKGRKLGGAYDYYLPQAYDLPMARPLNSAYTRVAQIPPLTYTPSSSLREKEPERVPVVPLDNQPSSDYYPVDEDIPPEEIEVAPPSATSAKKSLLFSRRKQENAAGIEETYAASDSLSSAPGPQGENRGRLPSLARKRNHAESDRKKEHVKNTATPENRKQENRRSSSNRGEDKHRKEKSEKGGPRQKKNKAGGDNEE